MARFRNKKKVFVKPAAKKQPQNVDHITGDKIPKSFVFSRTKLSGALKQLELDLRKLMLPYTALKLKISEQIGRGFEEFHPRFYTTITENPNLRYVENLMIWPSD